LPVPNLDPTAHKHAGRFAMSTFSNPVYDGYFADPFVLKTRDGYFAYGTGHGPERDGRQFPILRSADLSRWEYLGGALAPLPPEGGVTPFTAYWAPEVAEHEGRYYLYYSAATGGLDETHRLRVAIAERPEGPFQDAGRITLSGEFANVFCIDAHPFHDPKTGKWYLFFATDFFTERVGTGTAVVPLADDLRSAAGPAQTVLRASAEWHVYERNRPLYGKTWSAWHTVEGPFVWHHAGRYYCFYSGGNWQTHAYGVGYGVADDPLGPYVDQWNKEGPSVLRAIEGKVLGPGHNSVIVGPDGRTEYLVYHAWDAQRTARRMFIDPLIWMEDGTGHPPRPRCTGPTLDASSTRA
jgi:GH43 family beta-xylosidase